MPIISIIVPVYNVEKYLDKCVRSILAQTFKDFELILVDDGSNDRSGEMCDEYSKSDSRIKVIHKKNGGLSSARNAGIEISTGEFIGFVDSDDYIDDDMYELLYNNLIRENADMSICNKYDCYNEKPLKINKDCYKVLNTEEAIYSLCEGKMFGVSACDKLYKRELFEKIRYPEKRTAEDAFVIVELLMKCKIIVATTKQKYYHYHRAGSISSERSVKNCLDAMEADQKNYDLICSHYPSLRSIALQRICYSYFYALDGLLLNGESNYADKENEIIRLLRHNAMAVIFKTNFSIKRKLLMVILLFSKSIYKKILIAKFKYITPLNS